MHPEKVFLFNSCLPENCPGIERKIKDTICWNIGNTYITYSILKILFGGPVKVAHLPNAWVDPLPQSLADRINHTYSHLIFVMQDFIREDFKVFPFERVNQFLEKIKIPVVPISLGANSFNGYDLTLVSRLHNEQKRFLALVSDKSAMIGVRGRYTAELLDQMGIKNVQITGAPSYFESGTTRTIVKRPWNPDGVITTGAYFNAKLPNSIHVLQDEAYFIDVLFLRGEQDRSDANLLARPYYEYDMQFTLHLHRKAWQGLLRFFADIGRWKRFYEDQQWRLTIGTRLHSAIFSYNRGIPAIVTNVDSRARETCEHLGIPYRPDLGPDSDIAEEYEKLDLSPLNQKYSLLYANFLEYLKVHGLQPECLADEVELFQFPRIEAPTARQVQQALHGGLTELARFCDEKIRQCRTSENARQAAEKGRSSTECRLQIEEERLQAAEKRLKELEKFRSSKAGRLAARLQLLKHHFFKALHLEPAHRRKTVDFKGKKKDAA
jgi:Polysaccharide pyruvyl transferase